MCVSVCVSECVRVCVSVCVRVSPSAHERCPVAAANSPSEALAPASSRRGLKVLVFGVRRAVLRCEVLCSVFRV